MAIVALSNSANRLNDFETAVSTTSIGGGAAAGIETVTFFQGVQSVSRKCTTGDKGFFVTGLTSTDMTAGDDKVWMTKIFVSDGTDATATGIRTYIGSTTANYYENILYDDGTNVGLWPVTRSWLSLPWDPNVAAFHYGTTGTPVLTTVTTMAIVINVTNGTAKAENVFMDSIDLSDGLYLIGGTGADPDGTFDDFWVYDEGTQTNRFGHVIAQDGIYYTVGKLVIGRTAAGTATDTVFTDEGSVVVFPESKTDTGWNELEVDISSSATTVIDFTDDIFNGRGTGAARAFFGTTADITGNVVTLANYTGVLRTGDAVVYSNEGGAQGIGLTSGTTYWIFETGTIGDWTIHATYADGLAGTAIITLTAGGAEEHSFQKTPDTRPDFTVTGTAGTFTATGCTFDNFAVFTLTSKATMNVCKLLGGEQLTQNTATINSCSVAGSTTEDGEAYILCNDPAKIIDSDFTFSDGHAIELVAATAGNTYSFTGNTFTGFGAIASNDAAIYNNSGGTVTLNILGGGSTPTYRNGAGSTTIINNSVTLTVLGVTEGAAVKIIEIGSPQTVILETLADSNGEATTSINFTGDLPVVTRVRASGLPTAAIQDDNGVFTDETTAANSAVAADMNLLPAVPVINQDNYLFGHAEKFNKLKIDINTLGTGTVTIVWQYWNGATWTALADVVDDTSSFTVLGTNYVSFTLPGDWATKTENVQGPYFYIRAAYTAGTLTTPPLATRCSLNVQKYLPFVQDGTVTAAGLTVTASWNKDVIATF